MQNAKITTVAIFRIIAENHTTNDCEPRKNNYSAFKTDLEEVSPSTLALE
jgi:hypothetical protein